MRNLAAILTFLGLASLSMRADILFQDSLNYPYTNGPISGQGQWYTYSPKTNVIHDVLVINDNLILLDTNKESVATPTNGWVNDSETNFVSFQINVSKIPSNPNGDYFCQLQTTNDGVDVCHLFIDTLGTQVPGTYRLGIGNYATSFGGSYGTPLNLPLDLATNTTYTVVLGWDSDQGNLNFVGATLYVDPSPADGALSESGVTTGTNFVAALDDLPAPDQLNVVVTQVGFSPYANASISNVVAANTFPEVNTTNLPVFGVEPASQTNYSGNTEILYSVAAGSDMIYQWYDTNGPLVDDGVNIIGSTSNILTINNLASPDTYYVIATDAYGNQVTSASAVSTVITTPTAPFFPTNEVALNVTNNLFLNSGFTNLALGTGPLTYQWYRETTSISNGAPVGSFAPLAGQTGAALNVNLADYSYNGLYYVEASSSLGVAYGPTNSITEIAPLTASLAQLHALALTLTNEIALGQSPYVNSNNVTVSGYVSFYGGYGNTSYDEFMMQDTNGNAIQVYLKNPGNSSIDDSNTPPFGSFVSVQGPVEVYNGALEIDPVGIDSISVGPVATTPITPRLGNLYFNEFATNGSANYQDSNYLNLAGSLLTFTNVYLYSSSKGAPIAPGTTFPSTGGAEALYMFIGPYNSTNNTHYWEDYQRCPIYGGIDGTSVFANQPVPSYCYQLTAVLVPYGSTPEIIPSRLVDYVTTPPATFPVSIASTNQSVTLSWNGQAGSTYSLLTSTNLSGPWTKAAFGLGYIPTNGIFSDMQSAPAKYYQLTSP